MKKRYFHRLTEEEFNKIREEDITWEECAKRYPQPVWCGYPNAVCGLMGCASLMSQIVSRRNSCKRCVHYIKTSPARRR